MVMHMGGAMNKKVAVFAAVHVAVVLMTFGAAMGPSGAVVKGVVPTVGVMPAPTTLVGPVVVPPVEVVVVGG